MDFNNVRILGYTHNSNFFGDDIFRFRTDKNLSLQGTIVDLTGSNTLSTGIWTEADIISNFSEYEPVVINGTVFGSGRMDSINFEGGQDIDSKNYTADITIFSSGNLFNLTGEFYTGINIENYRYIEDLAEDFSYDTNGLEKSYKQSIVVRCFSGNAGNPLTLAKNIASNLISVNSITGLISDYNNVNNNPRYTESIDLINNTYQIEKFVTFGNESGNYSINKTYSVSLEIDGNTTVQENGEIKGLTSDYPWQEALTAVQTEIQGAYGNCNNVFSAYKADSAAVLNSKIVSLTKNLNRFTDTITYSVNFDNRTRNIPNGYSHEQTSDISRREDGIWQVNIRGIIGGWGVNYLQKFNAAKNGFDAIKLTLTNTARVGLRPHFISPISLNVSSSSVSFSQFNGSVEYDYVYVTDYAYKVSPFTNLNFKKQQVTISDNYKNRYINRYGIFNQKEIIQKGSISTVALRNLSLELIGRRGWPLVLYTNKARDIINNYIPGNDLLTIDVFISELNYNFDYPNNIFNLSMSWEYISSNPVQLNTSIEETQEVG